MLSPFWQHRGWDTWQEEPGSWQAGQRPEAKRPGCWAWNCGVALSDREIWSDRLGCQKTSAGCRGLTEPRGLLRATVSPGKGKAWPRWEQGRGDVPVAGHAGLALSDNLGPPGPSCKLSLLCLTPQGHLPVSGMRSRPWHPNAAQLLSDKLNNCFHPTPPMPTGTSPAPPWSWPEPLLCVARSADLRPSGRSGPGL